MWETNELIICAVKSCLLSKTHILIILSKCLSDVFSNYWTFLDFSRYDRIFHIFRRSCGSGVVLFLSVSYSGGIENFNSGGHLCCHIAMLPRLTWSCGDNYKVLGVLCNVTHNLWGSTQRKFKYVRENFSSAKKTLRGAGGRIDMWGRCIEHMCQKCTTESIFFT